MNTNYTDLYKFFIRQTKVNNNDLPSTEQGQKDLINDGVMEFNIRLRIGKEKLKCDDMLEELNEELEEEFFMFLSECMTLIVYKNMLQEYVSTWESFQNDVGRKYYKDQLNGKQQLINEQENRLKYLKLAISDEFVGDINGTI